MFSLTPNFCSEHNFKMRQAKSLNNHSANMMIERVEVELLNSESLSLAYQAVSAHDDARKRMVDKAIQAYVLNESLRYLNNVAIFLDREKNK